MAEQKERPLHEYVFTIKHFSNASNMKLTHGTGSFPVTW